MKNPVVANFIIASFLAFASTVRSQPTETGNVSKPLPSSKFDWKLRLSHGQKWRQTFSAHGTATQADPPVAFDPNYTLQQGFRQTLVLHNEVMFANPHYAIIRATFERYDQTTTFSVAGKADPTATPDRSKFTRAFLGVPFKIKRATDGRIVAISGLETLLARGRKSIVTLATSQGEREKLLDFLPESDSLHATITNCYGQTLPPSPLSPNESYSYDFEILPSFVLPRDVRVKRTLRSFDRSTALFDDQLTFNTFGEKPQLLGNDRIYIALVGTLSGHTTVEGVTGWARTALTLNLQGKTTQDLGAKHKRVTFLIKETSQFSISSEAI